MRATYVARAPVVTFLSASRVASEKAQRVLCALFSFQPIDASASSGDSLDSRRGAWWWWGHGRWDSIAAACPESGTVLHFLSSENHRASSRTTTDATMSLLSITDGGPANDDDVARARRVLADQTERASSFASGWRVALARATGREITPTHLLGRRASVPLMVIETRDDDEDDEQVVADGGLREIVVPYVPNDVHRAFFSSLARPVDPSTGRPVVGLCRWPGSALLLRPLPASAVDRSLPPPSLVIRRRDLDDDVVVADNNEEEAIATTSRVGFTSGGGGQLMVHHPALRGVDLRLCAATGLSSSFAEAQDALLAGSLDDLQSENVLVEGGRNQNESNDVKATRSRTDVKDKSIKERLLGDCWVEFRANMRRPEGFFSSFERGGLSPSTRGRDGGGRSAKAPDIPYE